MTQSWFASWFDTPWYHLLYNNRSHEEAASFIKKLTVALNVRKGATALDLACGKGRHAMVLHQAGLHVTGIDLSSASIEEASEKTTEGLQFLVHDMRLPIAKRFDYVFNLFTSLGYFESVEEDLQVLRSISAMLATDGVAIIDFMNAAKVIRQLVSEEVQQRGDVLFNINRSVNAESVIIKTIQVNTDEGVFDYQEQVRGYKLQNFQEMTLRCGLEIYKTCGDYNLNPFEEENSDRLILFLRHA